MKLLIGLCGPKGSGKNKAAELIADILIYSTYYSFATPMKNACKILFNWTEEHVNGKLKEVIDPNWGISPREVLQYIGTEMFQHNLPSLFPKFKEANERSFWVKHFTIWYENYVRVFPKCRVIITDVRFEHEIKEINRLGGFIIRINRNTKENQYSNHESEKGLPDNLIDFQVDNNGTIEELKNKLNKIIDQLYPENIRKQDNLISNNPAEYAKWYGKQGSYKINPWPTPKVEDINEQ